MPVLVDVARHRPVDAVLGPRPRRHRVDELLLAHLGEDAEEQDVARPGPLRPADLGQHREHREDRREEGGAAEDQQRQRRAPSPRAWPMVMVKMTKVAPISMLALLSAIAESWSWASWAVRIRCAALTG